jgi:flagellin-like protein
LKKGEVGIGTLIIFIAMILVAAIAASVLIQTATSLQNKALLTGSRTQDQVSAGMQTLLMYGTDGGDGTVEELRMKVKLLPGSGPIRFNETLIEVDVKNSSLDLKYAPDVCNDTNTNTTHFTVESLLEGPSHRTGYLQSGDVAMLCFDAPYSLGRDEDIQVRVVPKYAQTLIIETTLPDAILTNRVFIFP